MKNRHSVEQIIRILGEIEKSGVKISDACRPHGITEQTYYRWRKKYGGMEVNGASERAGFFIVVLGLWDRPWPRVRLGEVPGCGGGPNERIAHPPIEVFRFSPETLAAGVEERMIDGITVRVFSPEKTLADVFKFRNRIGLEIAVEALRTCARRKQRRFDLILDFARACRVEKIMRPYLEALS